MPSGVSLDRGDLAVDLRERFGDLLAAYLAARARLLTQQLRLREIERAEPPVPIRVGAHGTGPLSVPLGQSFLVAVLGVDQPLTRITHRPSSRVKRPS